MDKFVTISHIIPLGTNCDAHLTKSIFKTRSESYPPRGLVQFSFFWYIERQDLYVLKGEYDGIFAM